MVRRLTNVTGGVHVVALPDPLTLHDDLRVELPAALLTTLLAHHSSIITSLLHLLPVLAVLRPLLLPGAGRAQLGRAGRTLA